jgi:hypothetical protein
VQALLALDEWLRAHGTAESEETPGFLGGKKHLSTYLPKADRTVVQHGLVEGLDVRDDKSHSRFFNETQHHTLVARLLLILHMLVLFML